MSQSSRISASDVEHYREELEPGQISMEEMIKSPTSKNHAVLYKFISPLPGRTKNVRKQALETRQEDDNGIELAGNYLSDSEQEVVAMDDDQASTSGTQFVAPKNPPKPRGKRQPGSAAAATAAKKRAADMTTVNPKQKRTAKSKAKAPAIADGEDDDESDLESSKGGSSGIDDGDETETRNNPPPAKKTKSPSSPRVTKEVKRPIKPKGAKAVAKAFDDNTDDEEIEVIDVSGPPVEEKKAFKLRVSPAAEKDALFLSYEKYDKNGMFYLGLRRINNSSGYKSWLRIKPEELVGLEKGIAIAKRKVL